jgi:serine/threonine protein kinase
MTTPQRMQQIQELFHASLERSREERTRFLNQACAADPDLRREVETLLAAHAEADDFLAAPAAPPEAATQIQATPLPRTISHYEVLAPLGKGGMGEVYLASDQTLGRKVALKILPARYTTDADLVHRFEREAKAASALNHPNIMTVFEVGQTEDSHFIVTEYVEGETLRQRIARRNLPLHEALDIATQIAAALTAAHEAGIIHRDIKPENIMLRPDGYVKVLDFGLAKLTETTHSLSDSTTTQTGLIMGTPNYMSPEQARGQKVDTRTDLWSLGVVLFELVSGKRPFGGDSQADLLVAILEREPLPLPDKLPSELARTIHRALAKDLNQRYASAREFGQDLKALQHKLERATESVAEEVTLKQIIEAPTLPMAPALPTEPQSESPVVATPAPLQSPARSAVRAGLFGLLLLAGLGLGSWYWFKPAPPLPAAANPPTKQPPREFTWWLTVRRMASGKLESESFQSAGREWFPNGSKFTFHLTSPQAGYLYLLNEGPTAGGKTSLNLLYPTPANNNLNAAVAAQQGVQTGNYDFDIHQGEEKFWIVWAAQPVAEIEAVKAAATPAITAPTELILAFLNQHVSQSTTQTDEQTERTKVVGGEVIVSFVKLRHR